MSKPKIQYNSTCIKCGKVEEKMVRVGAVIFCNKCFPKVFETDNPILNERKLYLKWLTISIDKAKE